MLAPSTNGKYHRNMKIPRTPDDLQRQYKKQLDQLQFLVNGYDAGHPEAAELIAVKLRVLLHETSNSHSLLKQLNRLGGKFISTTFPFDPENVSTYSGLVMGLVDGPKSRYIAMLDEATCLHWLPFDEWWNQESVFVDDSKATFTRKKLITTAANQDGGARVDPGLDEHYSRLSSGHSMGWVWSFGGMSGPVTEAAAAAIRQIAHEVLKTLIPVYSNKVKHSGAFSFGGLIVSNDPIPTWRPHEKEKIGRDELCPCGSGKKYQHCHGLTL